MRSKSPITHKCYACDFETSVYDGQTDTEVWAAGYCQLLTHDCKTWNNLDDFMEWLLSLETNSLVYFHNLKFDGAFILNWFFRHGWKYSHGAPRDLNKNEFCASISKMGQWYKIDIPSTKGRSGYIEIRDSLKLLPFSLRKVTRDFRVKHQKLEMEYKGERHAGYIMNPDEADYFRNDLFGLAEALEECFARGVNALTIGAECLKEFKSGFDAHDYECLFPDLTEIELPTGESADEYCRKAYRGGWCYVNPIFREKRVNMGFTLDVNSLYPSRMHSEGGCYYPVGLPRYLSNKDDAYFKNMLRIFNGQNDIYFYIRIKCVFTVKPDHLPTIQIHGDHRFNPREYLTTSKFIQRDFEENPETGHLQPSGQVTITLTKTDFNLFFRQYNVSHLEYIDLVYFDAVKGIFDRYLNVYRALKLEAKNNVDRTLAKLYMNHLYGKTAASTDSSYKVPYLGADGALKFITRDENAKTPGYIAIGAAITAYAREFTIAAAQANYDIFCYADTDSIHCIGKPEDAKGVILHDKNFNCWKCEGIWYHGWFVRAKSYIEVYGEDDYLIKCAGMPQNCKDLLAKQFRRNDPRIHCCGYEDFTSFRPGITVHGKLTAKQIPGGVLLVPTTFKFKTQEPIDKRRKKR